MQTEKTVDEIFRELSITTSTCKINFEGRNYVKVYWAILQTIESTNISFDLQIGFAKSIDHNVIWVLRENLNTAIGFTSYEDVVKFLEEKEYFSFDSGRIRPLYKYCEIFPSARSQYLYYANRLRGMVILFQVGCFYEFYADIKEDVMTILRLKRLGENKRGARYGFPVRLENEYVNRLIDKGIPLAIIRETDRYIGRIKERLPVMKILKAEG